MFALNPISFLWTKLSILGHHFILPRFLRKPVRFLMRLSHGDVQAPFFSFLIFSTVFFITTGVYGCYLGGHIAHLMRALSFYGGFGLDKVEIVGNQRISEIEVLDRLALGDFISLFSVNPSLLRKQLSKMEWVKNVSVQKIYPNTIRVDLEERVPFAVWQENNLLYLVETSGSIITPLAKEDLVDKPLPFIVGKGAAKAFSDFSKTMKNFPEIESSVKNYVRVGDRRWNLILDTGVVIKLPEIKVKEALGLLVEQEQKIGLLERDILSVDLRLWDSIVVQLTRNALLRRQVSLQKAGVKTVNSPGERT